jgi:hypothetical protein
MILFFRSLCASSQQFLFFILSLCKTMESPRAVRTSQAARFGQARVKVGLQKRKQVYEGHVVRLRERATDKARDCDSPDVGRAKASVGAAQPHTASGYTLVPGSSGAAAAGVEMAGKLKLLIAEVLDAAAASGQDAGAAMQRQYVAVSQMRRHANREPIPVDEFVQSGALVLLQRLISPSYPQALVSEAAHTLVGLTSVPNSTAVSAALFDAGIFGQFGAVLADGSVTETTARHCLWCVSNIICDSKQINYRDAAEQAGLLGAMFSLWALPTGLAPQTVGMCVMMCRAALEVPPMPADAVCSKFAAICTAALLSSDIMAPENESQAVDALVALQILAQKAGSPDAPGVADLIIGTPGVPERLVQLYTCSRKRVSNRAVHTVSLFVSHLPSSPLLNAGLVRAIGAKIDAVMTAPKTGGVRRALVWTVANIATENEVSVAELMSAGLYRKVVDLALDMCTRQAVTCTDGTTAVLYQCDDAQYCAVATAVEAVYMIHNISLSQSASTPEYLRMCCSARAFDLLGAAAAASSASAEEFCMVLVSTIQAILQTDINNVEQYGWSFGAFEAFAKVPTLEAFLDECEARLSSDDDHAKLEELTATVQQGRSARPRQTYHIDDTAALPPVTAAELAALDALDPFNSPEWRSLTTAQRRGVQRLPLLDCGDGAAAAPVAALPYYPSSAAASPSPNPFANFSYSFPGNAPASSLTSAAAAAAAVAQQYTTTAPGAHAAADACYDDD